jgi:hypothetical protein
MDRRYRSAEELEAERLNVLGPQLGPLYHALYSEVLWLHAKWKQYRHLYASADNVNLLNDTAGFFFRVVQDMMWGDTMLHIARLMDRPRSVGKENLTLCRLAGAIGDTALAARVAALVESAETDTAFVRDWRNRRLAHSDLQLALDSGAQPLPAVSRDQMERALAALRAVMNEIQIHYWGSPTEFEEFVARSDAESLTYYLSQAIKAEIKQQERWSRGEVMPEDLNP